MLIETIGDKNLPIQDPIPANSEVFIGNGILPINFGIVTPGKLYRSGLPSLNQIEEVQARFNIQHLVSLVGGDWIDEGYLMNTLKIQHHQFDVLQRRALTKEKVRELVARIENLDGPVLVHCLKGAVRTSQVVAGYQIQHDGMNNIEAILRGVPYGLVNISSIREILKY